MRQSSNSSRNYHSNWKSGLYCTTDQQSYYYWLFLPSLPHVYSINQHFPGVKKTKKKAFLYLPSALFPRVLIWSEIILPFKCQFEVMMISPYWVPGARALQLAVWLHEDINISPPTLISNGGPGNANYSSNCKWLHSAAALFDLLKPDSSPSLLLLLLVGVIKWTVS